MCTNPFPVEQHTIMGGMGDENGSLHWFGKCSVPSCDFPVFIWGPAVEGEKHHIYKVAGQKRKKSLGQGLDRCSIPRPQEDTIPITCVSPQRYMKRWFQLYETSMLLKVFL